MGYAEHSPDPSQADLPDWELSFLAGRARSLLRAGVPLTLLMDLADPHGPASQEVYDSETSEVGWLPGPAG